MKTFSKVNSQKIQKIHVPHILSPETPGGCSQTNGSTKNEKAVGLQEAVSGRAGRGRADSRGSERPRNAPWGS